MHNVKGESLSLKITKCIKVLGELNNHVYDREKLRDALQYFIRKIRLGSKDKENNRIMEIEFPSHLEMLSAPDGI